MARAELEPAKQRLAVQTPVFDRLTEPQREVLTLARVVGLPHAVIAARLGRSGAAQPGAQLPIRSAK